jgi:hypothetical protein
MSVRASRRVLAIDPTSRGFGFVVLEGRDQLIDWGLKSIRRNKEEATLLAVAELIERYPPDVLVLEDYQHRRCRRRERVRRLLHLLRAVAADRDVVTRLVSVAHVSAYFAAQGATTKYAIAGLLTARFPVLARHRPKIRKAWMSEDERQAIFDAAACALALHEGTRMSLLSSLRGPLRG